MKLQRTSTILFVLYVLLTFSLAAYSMLYANGTTENFNYDKNASTIATVFRAFSYAMERTVKALDIWVRFVIAALLLNFLFYATLMWFRKIYFSEFILLFGLTLLASFGLFLLILILFQWTIGEYLNVACPLLVATFYVSRKAGLFSQKQQHSFKKL
ncbi:MAG TPA: hypothetical protein VHB70_12835 [Parafilimonas sp.]|nr:hypothetical protein [Parafilimonas sp.]